MEVKGSGAGSERAGSYHHHVSGKRVGQVCDRGTPVSIRGVALGAVHWLVASVEGEETDSSWCRDRAVVRATLTSFHPKREREMEADRDRVRGKKSQEYRRKGESASYFAPFSHK